MPQKLDGKFYPLQITEWGKTCRELTKTQLSVLFYIRCLDPYSNGYRLCAPTIAKELGISRQAVYKAITALLEKEFIREDKTEYGSKILGLGCLCDNSLADTQLSPVDDTVNVGRQLSTDSDTVNTGRQLSTAGDTVNVGRQTVNTGRQLSTDGDNCKQAATTVNVGRQTQLETHIQQAFHNSKINKTYKDFKDSLSDSERESFLKFAREKANELPKIPTLLDRWIEKNWVELRVHWKPTHVSSSSSSSKEFCVADWKEHPQFKEWVREADNRYMWFINRCDCPLTKQERQALIDWVRANPGEVVS